TPTLSYSCQPTSRCRSLYTPGYAAGNGKSGAGVGLPAAAASRDACSYNAARNRSVPAPEVTITCQGCELHQEGDICATASICSMRGRGTGSGRYARQL